MKNILMLLALFLCGCSAVDVSQSVNAKSLVGQCYQFTEPGELIEAQGADKGKSSLFSASYLFVSAKSQSYYVEREGNGALKQSLATGTNLKIVKVIDYPYGINGALLGG